jgi:2-oxopent-4-enoate/cis-2-oxohex-4-enoate hydratase
MTTDINIKALGLSLYESLVNAQPIAPLTEMNPALSIEDAYNIQQALMTLRYDRGGERIIGKKIGVTSQPVMDMLGVNQPDFGMLTDRMVIPQGGEVDLSRLIQPKAEGEIAFVLKHDLHGPGITAADVLRATEGIMPCFEIVDSRIRDWKIAIQDTIADNASCGVFVLGDKMVSPNSVNLYSIGMVLRKNGRVVGTGAGAASLGSPVNAMVWLANQLGELGMSLKAGEVILSGALSAMVPIAQGDLFEMTLDGVGSCQFIVT